MESYTAVYCKGTIQKCYGRWREGECEKLSWFYIKVVLKPPASFAQLRSYPGSPRRNKKNMYIKKAKKGIDISSQKATIVKSKSPETLNNTILFSRYLHSTTPVHTTKVN
jgi:hypothetical protein